jgi:phosphonate metabolism protein PhnN/1,5-bisphosphokinase (PRPP-forming)
MTIAPLVLVVGPSGAGKDALMEGARQRLAAEGLFHFAKRVVTRPLSAGGEDHDGVTVSDFRRIEVAGDFLLSWEAHGLAYGIRRSVEAFRRDGTAVVANVSRSVVERARHDLAPVSVVVVTAPLAVLAARLNQRGRESAPEISSRLARAPAFMPSGDGVFTLSNDRSLDEGVDRFVDILKALHRPRESTTSII